MRCQELPLNLYKIFFLYLLIFTGLPLKAKSSLSGRELTYAHCQACHSSKLFEQQSLSRKNWDKLITWMQKNHGLWPLDTDTREQILDFLSTNYGEKKTSLLSNMDEGLFKRQLNPLAK